MSQYTVINTHHLKIDDNNGANDMESLSEQDIPGSLIKALDRMSVHHHHQQYNNKKRSVIYKQYSIINLT